MMGLDKVTGRYVLVRAGNYSIHLSISLNRQKPSGKPGDASICGIHEHVMSMCELNER